MSNPPSIVQQNLLTNCIHSQWDPAINCIHPQGSGTGHFSALCQPYQLYPAQRAYQIVAEEFGYKGTNNHLLVDLLDVSYAEEEPDNGDIFYLTENLEKLFINFLSMELVCHRCKSTFFSKSLMHKHLKSNCVGQNQGNTAPLPAAPVF